MLKIYLGGEWQAFLCPWLYSPGFLDCWAVGLRVKNIVEKGEMQVTKMFPYQYHILSIVPPLWSANTLNLVVSEILLSGTAKTYSVSEFQIFF